MAQAVAILTAVVLAGFGWSAPWPDPAQAGAALQWIAFGLLCQIARGNRAGLARMAGAAGIGIAAAGAGCASFFDLMSQTIGSCDEGTGRPVTAAIAIALLAVCAQFLKDGYDDKRTG